MMSYIYNKVLLPLAVCGALMTSFIFSACVKEPINEGSRPIYTGVTFEYDMSNLSSFDTLPHHMQIAANRLVYSRMTRIYYDLDSLNGYFLNNLPDSMTAEENQNLDTFKLEQGQYRFYTINMEMKTFDMSEVQAYLDSGKIATIGGHFVKYQTFDRDNDSLKENLKDWIDYNAYKNDSGQYVKFLNSIEEPLVIDSTEITKLPKNGSLTIKFAPKSLTHNVDVYFDIKKNVDELSFVIDSVYCVFSGIPNRIDMGTGALDFSWTNKLLTKMSLVSNSAVPTVSTSTISDSQTNSVVRCYKNMNILGMTEISTLPDDNYLGPSVMQVILYATVYEKDGTTRNRVANGLVNMHNALTTAKLQTYDPVHNIYKRSRDHTVIPVNIDLTIGKDILLGNDDGGIPQWKKESLGEGDVY